MSHLATPVLPVTPQPSPSARGLRPLPPTGGPNRDRRQVKRSKPSPGGGQWYGPYIIFCGNFTVALYLHSNSSTLFKRKKEIHVINLIFFFMYLFTLFYRVSLEMFEKKHYELFSLWYKKEVLNLMVGGCLVITFWWMTEMDVYSF